MTKEYLKMADVFVGDVIAGDDDLIRDEDGLIGDMLWPPDCVKYAAHAINSHDELVAEVERLRVALQQCQIALLIADRFCGNHTADDCGDDVAIPIRDALIATTKNLA